MTEEINLDEEETKRRKPYFTTFIGLLAIGGVVAMPFIAGEPDGEKMPDMVRFLGHFHPVVLHLPIGVFMLILAQEFFAMFSRKSRPKPMFPLFFGAASAVVAVIFGFLLYQGGGFEGEMVEDHLWGGIAFSALAILTFVVKAWSMAPAASQAFYRLMLFVSVGVMSYASHDGASITHGKDYLWKYAPNEIRELIGLEPKEEKEEIEVKPLEEQIVYADIVAPILEMRCVQCHKEGKSKGRFRMDTYELLVKGGKEGEGIEPGNALDSNIVFRAELPEDDDEHMPPEGKKDIEDHELAVVKWWIDSGADPEKTVGELELTDEIRTAIGQLEFVSATSGDEGAGEKPTSDGPSEEFKKAVSELGEQFPGGLTFESQASSNLTFTGVSMREKLTDEEFTKLKPVISKLVTVDLSSSSITDASVALLADAENLRMVRLSETGISDTAIDTLVQLQNLESVNLYGTAVTDEGVKKLSMLPNLKMLYLWQTEVSQEVIEELKKALPELEVVKGI
ncbi:MAG: c-type cytochrome domain-containing protein [Akkermansiaceae bacterium]